jgi:dTDP-4-dehydrorhamnose reductase
MRALLDAGKTLTLYTDQYRTPAYTGDTVEAVYRLVKKRTQGVYHVGGSERLSRYEFGRKFARRFSLPEDRFVPVRMGDTSMGAPRGSDCSLNTEKLQQELDIHPCNAEEGLRRQKREEETLAE